MPHLHDGEPCAGVGQPAREEGTSVGQSVFWGLRRATFSYVSEVSPRR